MRLYIAEKPSMGRELAKCLKGPMERHDGWIRTGGGVVTWLFGHVLRQAEPAEYDPKYKQWRADDLPIIPHQWKLFVDDGAAKQFNTVKMLIAKADEIVNAGDPDREGQLLVDEVLDFVGNEKPVKRILLNALDEKSIRKANDDLRDNSDFVHLKESALARSRADWLIGMNLSRAYTLAARRAGHRGVLPVGRVKTPTLALVVRREREIQSFKPVDYYHIKATFHHENGDFTAQLKPKDDMDGLDSEGRIVDKKTAESILEKLQSAPYDAVVMSYQKTKKEEKQCLPFSLSSLQVQAGKRFGMDPQTVLDTAQSLYEKKLTTYPRSDCEYLPLNQLADAPAILGNLIAHGGTVGDWAKAASPDIKSRAWNDKKISAHHAIIPTAVRANPSAMTDNERKIYFLIARSYIAQFYPVHRFYQTKIGISYKDELFAANGRTIIDAGWKALYMKKKQEDDDEDQESDTLPSMEKGDHISFTKGDILQKVTKPPVRFTPSTLLAGMKEIHKYVKNPDAKKQLKDVYGIGTEATRATIIDDLIKRSFLKPQGKKKYLIPQPSAYLLIDALPDEMTYPDSTAIWEDRLHSMAQGEGTVDEFIAGQAEFARKLCQKAYDAKMHVDGIACPRCGNGVMQNRHGKNGDFWGCSNYPRCRMTCDDKDGKPDIEGARSRVSHTRSDAGSFSGHLSEEEMASFLSEYKPSLTAREMMSRDSQ